ncbi:unnamed protein product [Prunus brigantina]
MERYWNQHSVCCLTFWILHNATNMVFSWCSIHFPNLLVSIIQVMDSCMVAYDHTEQRPLFLKLHDKISPTLASLIG